MKLHREQSSDEAGGAEPGVEPQPCAEEDLGGARITEALAAAELGALPELSATLVRFAAPILAVLPEPPSRADLELAMTYAMVAWNLPLFEQAGLHPELSEAWQDAAPRLAPPVRASVEGMLRERRTTHRRDPRIANVEVRDGGDGTATVHAEVSLVVRGRPPR